MKVKFMYVFPLMLVLIITTSSMSIPKSNAQFVPGQGPIPPQPPPGVTLLPGQLPQPPPSQTPSGQNNPLLNTPLLPVPPATGHYRALNYNMKGQIVILPEPPTYPFTTIQNTPCPGMATLQESVIQGGWKKVRNDMAREYYLNPKMYEMDRRINKAEADVTLSPQYPIRTLGMSYFWCGIYSGPGSSVPVSSLYQPNSPPPDPYVFGPLPPLPPAPAPNYPTIQIEPENVTGTNTGLGSYIVRYQNETEIIPGLNNGNSPNPNMLYQNQTMMVPPPMPQNQSQQSTTLQCPKGTVLTADYNCVTTNSTTR